MKMTQNARTLTFYPIEQNSTLGVQWLDVSVHAGFPSPVDDAYVDAPIDLNKELVSHPATTFLARVMGDSMIEEGVEDGDLLVIDRSIEPNENHIAVCFLNREFALKRIKKQNGRILLLSGNAKYPPIEVANEDDFRVYGVVTWVMKKKV